jgi:hypothetical protein
MHVITRGLLPLQYYLAAITLLMNISISCFPQFLLSTPFVVPLEEVFDG